MIEPVPAWLAPRGRQQPRIEYIDRHVGLRLRQRRILVGLTQTELADRLGVAYQQVHKYETGVNRLSAGRLCSCARALGVDINYFFEGLDIAPDSLRPSAKQRHLLDLLRHFRMIRDRRHQSAVCAVARALSERHQDS